MESGLLDNQTTSSNRIYTMLFTMTENNKDLKKIIIEIFRNYKIQVIFIIISVLKKIQERHHYYLLRIDEGATY